MLYFTLPGIIIKIKICCFKCFNLSFTCNYFLFKNVISFNIILYITQYLTKIIIIKVLSVLLFSQMYFHVIVLHFTNNNLFILCRSSISHIIIYFNFFHI